MPFADIDGDCIRITVDLREHELIESVPGSRWSKTAGWSIPLAWAPLRSARGIFGNRLMLSDQLIEWAWIQRHEWIDEAQALRRATTGDGDPRLLPFQRPGVAMLKLVKRMLLLDDMGCGKTVQVSRAIHELNLGPVLIVCPKSVMSGWVGELAKWAPNLEPMMISGGPIAKRKQFAAVHGRSAVIINIEAVRLHSRLAGYGSIGLSASEKQDKELNGIPFQIAVLDEAHRCINPQAKQTRAVWRAFSQAEYRWALTGTPISNAPDDLWALLHLISPDEFPSRVKWVSRFCAMSYNPFGGLDVIGVRPDTRDEFFDIVDMRVRRMTKELVLSHLPPKVREVRWVDMSPKQAKAYKEMSERQVAELDDETAVLATNNLTKNTRLIQFSSSYAQLDEHNQVRLTEPSNKLDEMMDFLADIGPNRSVVFAAESRQLIDMASTRLTKAKIEHAMIVGGMHDMARRAAIEDFQSGRVRVMLITIAAGGVGLNLTRADTLVFLQRSWSMILNKQTEDRVHRIGSEMHDSILIVDFVTPGTIEEGQIDKVRKKLVRLEEIVRDRELLRDKAAEGDLVAQARIAQLEQEETLINSPMSLMEAS